MINYKNRHLEKSTFLREKEGEDCAHLLRAHLLISPTEELECWVWWDLWKNTANAGEPGPPIPAMLQLGETAK